jgi:anti-anti-sigma factor
MHQVTIVSAPTEVVPVPAPPFRCTLRTGGSRAAWVDVSGELDMLTSPQLANTFKEAELHARLVVLDMRAVSFMDCSGLRVLLAASTEFEWGGARLMVVASSAVDRILTLTGACERIGTCDLSSVDPRTGSFEVGVVTVARRSRLPARASARPACPPAA